MRVRPFAALVLFFGSYLPLSLILLAQDFDYRSLDRPLCLGILWQNGCHLPLLNPSFSISIFVTCLACFIGTLAVLRKMPKKREVVLSEAKHIPAELMNYTLPYVVSFMSISYDDTGKFVGLLVFLLWMFWITYRSNQIILNPILIAFGWRLYEVSYRFAGDEHGFSGRALCQGELSSGERHKFSTIQDVMIFKAGALNDDADFERSKEL